MQSTFSVIKSGMSNKCLPQITVLHVKQSKALQKLKDSMLTVTYTMSAVIYTISVGHPSQVDFLYQ